MTTRERAIRKKRIEKEIVFLDDQARYIDRMKTLLELGGECAELRRLLRNLRRIEREEAKR